MTFTFEELNEIGNTAKQCGLDVRTLSQQPATSKKMHCKNILRSVGRIKEDEIGDIMNKTEFDVQNRPSFINVGGMLVSAGSVGFRVKSDLLRRIENLVD